MLATCKQQRQQALLASAPHRRPMDIEQAIAILASDLKRQYKAQHAWQYPCQYIPL